VNVLAVTNTRLGDTITVAGLLMGADVLDQVHAAGYGDLIVLPRVMFDHPDRISLDNLSSQDIANQLNRPVALADSLGDVWDALHGRSALAFRPGAPPSGSIDLKVINNGADDGSAHFS
jgi:NifB/MoaA-like Fe-S oxidoreductase